MKRGRGPSRKRDVAEPRHRHRYSIWRMKPRMNADEIRIFIRVIRGYYFTWNHSPRPSFVFNILNISSYVNGRAPRRPNTETLFPLSSTARSRSRGFEIARASPFVLNVAISTGLGLGLNPAYSGIVSGEVSCKIRIPFFPSAT